MKTAVKKLIEHIEKIATSSIDGNTTIVINTNDLNKLLREALVAEKIYIMRAYLSATGYSGNCESHQMKMLDKRFLEQAEQYYNETTS